MDSTPPPRFPPPSRKSDRRWHLGPVILHGPELLDRARLLDEYPEPAGLLLWLALRDIHLWAAMPADKRPRLFAEGALARRTEMLGATEVDAEIRAPVQDLSEILGPADADAEKLARACLRVSEWAVRGGRGATALDYAQAASLARPNAAQDALRVAYLAQELGEHARAETWFRRTVTVARQSVDRESYAQGLLGLGRLYRLRGTPRVAQRFFVRAQRAAVRWGLRSTRIEVLMELLSIASEVERFVTAEQYARSAFELAAADGKVVPGLAHEVARVWLARAAFAEARQLLEALRPGGDDSEDRVQVVSDLVWALGGTGERGPFERVWGHAWEELGGIEPGSTRARALLSLASGAALMQDAGRALHAAEQAVIAARESGDRRIRVAAENALRALREGDDFPVLPPVERRTVSAGTRSFAAALVRSIEDPPKGEG